MTEISTETLALVCARLLDNEGAFIVFRRAKNGIQFDWIVGHSEDGLITELSTMDGVGIEYFEYLMERDLLQRTNRESGGAGDYRASETAHARMKLRNMAGTGPE
jgi:hypothetical protein